MNKHDGTIDFIEHSATVTETFPKRNAIEVRISDADGCGSCPAAALCRVSGEKGSLLEIPTRSAGSYCPGEKVTVIGTERMHRRAIMLATVIPCIVLVAVMVIVFLLTFDQMLAALCGLGTMTAFFVILYFLRNKIAHEFSFTVRKNRQ